MPDISECCFLQKYHIVPAGWLRELDEMIGAASVACGHELPHGHDALSWIPGARH